MIRTINHTTNRYSGANIRMRHLEIPARAHFLNVWQDGTTLTFEGDANDLQKFGVSLLTHRYRFAQRLGKQLLNDLNNH